MTKRVGEAGTEGEGTTPKVRGGKAPRAEPAVKAARPRARKVPVATAQAMLPFGDDPAPATGGAAGATAAAPVGSPADASVEAGAGATAPPVAPAPAPATGGAGDPATLTMAAAVAALAAGMMTGRGDVAVDADAGIVRGTYGPRRTDRIEVAVGSDGSAVVSLHDDALPMGEEAAGDAAGTAAVVRRLRHAWTFDDRADDMMGTALACFADATSSGVDYARGVVVGVYPGTRITVTSSDWGTNVEYRERGDSHDAGRVGRTGALSALLGRLKAGTGAATPSA